jgi:hypothetical protein
MKYISFDINTGKFWRRKTNQFDASMYDASVIIKGGKSFKLRKSNESKCQGAAYNGGIIHAVRNIYLGSRKDWIYIAKKYQEIMGRRYLRNMGLDPIICIILANSRWIKYRNKYFIKATGIELFDQILHSKDEISFFLEDENDLDNYFEEQRLWRLWFCTSNKQIVAMFKLYGCIVIDINAYNKYLNDIITTRIL